MLLGREKIDTDADESSGFLIFVFAFNAGISVQTYSGIKSDNDLPGRMCVGRVSPPFTSHPGFRGPLVGAHEVILVRARIHFHLLSPVHHHDSHTTPKELNYRPEVKAFAENHGKLLALMRVSVEIPDLNSRITGGLDRGAGINPLPFLSARAYLLSTVAASTSRAKSSGLPAMKRVPDLADADVLIVAYTFQPGRPRSSADTFS